MKYKEQQSRKIPKLLKIARKFVVEEQTENAKGLYYDILKLKPDCYDALLELGLLMQKNDVIGESEILYRKAIRVEPGRPEAYNNLGNVADFCNMQDKALALYEKAINIHPDYAEAHYNRGVVLHKLSKIHDAISAYKKCILLDDKFTDAYCNLGIAYHEIGNKSEAIESFNKVLEMNSEHALALHLSNSLKGSGSKSAPDEYVRKLFDDIAQTFEHTLVNNLEYSFPKDLRIEIGSIVSKKIDILDLGCGTGLVGDSFRDMSSKLVGVDISPKMLMIAENKNIYDSLHCSNILDYLSQNKEKYDLIIAADVFVYVGDLEPVFAQLHHLAHNTLHLAFSIELTEDNLDYILSSTGRYKHSNNYIRRLADMYGYSEVISKSINIRKEGGQRTDGACFILKRV